MAWSVIWSGGDESRCRKWVVLVISNAATAPANTIRATSDKSKGLRFVMDLSFIFCIFGEADEKDFDCTRYIIPLSTSSIKPCSTRVCRGLKIRYAKSIMVSKICIITCYKDPDYVRARTLRAALQANADLEVIIIKNRHKNALRYPEVIAKILKVRLTKNPDTYLLTFRGYELLPFFYLLTLGKKRIFDEFINLIEWTVFEHKKIRENTVAAKFLWGVYRFFLKRNKLILTDTQVHAEYSAKLMNLPLGKFVAVPVSTDEEVFRPLGLRPDPEGFRVFYYGNMLPLHGLQYVIDAAIMLKANQQVLFLFIGGGSETELIIEKAKAEGANIEYKKWVPFDDLPRYAAESDICLGGPFGNTLQARMVITGKTYQFLAMGAPTMVGDVDEATPFEDGKNCLLVKQADSSAIATKIEWACNHKEELKKIGQNGRKTYESHYSSKVVNQRVADLLGGI